MTEKTVFIEHAHLCQRICASWARSCDFSSDLHTIIHITARSVCVTCIRQLEHGVSAFKARIKELTGTEMVKKTRNGRK